MKYSITLLLLLFATIASAQSFVCEDDKCIIEEHGA